MNDSKHARDRFRGLSVDRDTRRDKIQVAEHQILLFSYSVSVAFGCPWD